MKFIEFWLGSVNQTIQVIKDFETCEFVMAERNGLGTKIISLGTHMIAVLNMLHELLTAHITPAPTNEWT